MGYTVKQSARRAKESLTSPLSVPIAPYLTDDHVAVFLAIQGNSSAITTPAGWTAVGTLSRTGSTAGQWFVKKMTADETAESTQSFTFSGSGTAVAATSVVVRGIDTSWLASISSGVDYFNTGTSASATFASAANAASGSANALMLVGGIFNSDSIARCYMDALTSISLERNINTAHFVGYKQMPATSYGSPALTAYRSASGNSQMCLLMMKTATGAALQPNCVTNVTEAQWYGSFGVNNSAMNPTWGMPDAATIDGLATYTSGTPTMAATSASTSTNPDTLLAWNTLTSVGISAASVGASDLWVGYKHAFTTDLSGNKAVSLSWRVPYGNAVAHIGSKGVIVKFSSSSSDWVAYRLDAKDDFVLNVIKNVVIQPGVTPVYASGGTYAPGSQAEVTYLWHRIAGNTTAANIDFMNLVVFDPAAPAQIIGGGEAYPATPYALVEALRSWNSYRLGWLQSSAQAMTYGSVQIGDGSKLTYWDSSAWSFGFPQKYNAAIQNTWRVAEDTMSISLKPSSADTILITAGSFVSDGAQAFDVDAAGSVPASYSFSGQSFVGLTVTDNLGLSWSNAVIKSGGKMTLAAGGDMTDSAIRDTTATDAALSVTADGTVLTRTIVDGTGALYAAEFGTSVTETTLADCTLTAGSTDKVHVLATTGTVTITISGTTSLVAGDVTSAGATVVIAAPQPTLDATVLSGTRVVLYNNTTSAELDNTAPAGTSWSKTITGGASANDNLTLFAFKEGYAEFSTSFLYSGEDTTILVTQVVDDVVAAFRTEDSITDYTTLTEYNIYAPTIYIQADDADGVSKISRLATYYNGILTTEDGARYFRGGMSMISTGAVRVNKSVIELLLENVSATKSLRFSDEATRRLYTDDGTSIIAPSSVAGSIEYAYGGVPDTVETGVSGLTAPESAQLMGLPSSTAIAAAVWAYVVEGSTTALQWVRLVASVLLGKVSGAGTGTETFRDLADTKDRVVSTVDNDGNRTAVARDGT